MLIISLFCNYYFIYTSHYVNMVYTTAMITLICILTEEKTEAKEVKYIA